MCTERTEDYSKKNLSRMTREAKERESLLNGGLDRLRNQQEKTLCDY